MAPPAGSRAISNGMMTARPKTIDHGPAFDGMLRRRSPSMYLVRVLHRSGELLDREVRPLRGPDEQALAPGNECCRGWHLARDIEWDHDRAMLVGVDKITWPHGHALHRHGPAELLDVDIRM